MLFAKTAILLKLYSVGSVFAVFLSIIIALFALRTCQSYADSHDFLPYGCFNSYVLKKLGLLKLIYPLKKVPTSPGLQTPNIIYHFLCSLSRIIVIYR